MEQISNGPYIIPSKSNAVNPINTLIPNMYGFTDLTVFSYTSFDNFEST